MRIATCLHYIEQAFLDATYMYFRYLTILYVESLSLSSKVSSIENAYFVIIETSCIQSTHLYTTGYAWEREQLLYII